MTPDIHALYAQTHLADLRRDARASDRTRRPGGHAWPGDELDQAAIVIRRAFPDDAQALERLADLDSRRVPAGPLLVAEVDGELRAALALDGGRAIADPFRRTVHLVDLLELRAGLAREPAPPRWRRALAHHRRPALAA